MISWTKRLKQQALDSGVEDVADGTDFFQRIQADISQFYNSPREPQAGRPNQPAPRRYRTNQSWAHFSLPVEKSIVRWSVDKQNNAYFSFLKCQRNGGTLKFKLKDDISA